MENKTETYDWKGNMVFEMDDTFYSFMTAWWKYMMIWWLHGVCNKNCSQIVLKLSPKSIWKMSQIIIVNEKIIFI